MRCACDISVIVVSDLQLNIVQTRPAECTHKAKPLKEILLYVSGACLKRTRVRIRRDFKLKTMFDE